ncbi:MAG: glutathione S-transferase N-terminal domain-containing protein [Pseudomonadota bacterium]
MNSPLSLASSLLASAITMPHGVFSEHRKEQPAQPLALYDMENCPHCRLVRQALTSLDLDALIYPCPKGGERFRSFVTNAGGKAQFPFLIDPNTGQQLYESTRIVSYLYDTYSRRHGWALRVPLLSKPPVIAASAIRQSNGLHVQASRVPEKPLQLWSFEASPFARLVRERLCELELPYYLHNVGKTDLTELLPPGLRARWLPDYTPVSTNRNKLKAQAGRVQVPYLMDPNTNTSLFESADILRYLNKRYARKR